MQLKLTVDLVQLQGSWCTPKERCHRFDVILWPMQPFLLDFLGDQSSETPRSNVEKNCRCNDSNCFWLKRLTNLDRSFVFFWCQLSHPIFLKLFRSIHCSLPTTSVSKLFLFVYQPRDVQGFSGKCQEKGFIWLLLSPLKTQSYRRRTYNTKCMVVVKYMYYAWVIKRLYNANGKISWTKLDFL